MICDIDLRMPAVEFRLGNIAGISKAASRRLGGTVTARGRDESHGAAPTVSLAPDSMRPTIGRDAPERNIGRPSS